MIDDDGSTIPVLRPLLPRAERLLPYLRRIDESRVYTNWGPLASELEGRLANHFGLARDGVVSASSGTTALVGAILATAGRARPERPFAIVPAFTFVATAIAAEQCGYRPYVVDVGGDDWLLSPDRLFEHPLLGQAGLVIAVATFGRAIGQERWREFRRATGVAVVIDGAASFEAASAAPQRVLGDIPVAMSFHATKTFSTGEGGCVATTDGPLAARVTEALNFGFYESRNSRSASTNGKMSEYHAAVGLAELDGWAAKRSAFEATAHAFRIRLDSAGLRDHLVSAPTIAGCYVLFRCSSIEESARVQENLTRSHIEFRFWYGNGLIAQSHFQHLLRDPLSVTTRIAPLLVGLPVATDLPGGAIDRIATALRSAVSDTT
jgi:dTDP-4-amino-4,6-dideoxygalactose transaminase